MPDSRMLGPDSLYSPQPQIINFNNDFSASYYSKLFFRDEKLTAIPKRAIIHNSRAVSTLEALVNVKVDGMEHGMANIKEYILYNYLSDFKNKNSAITDRIFFEGLIATNFELTDRCKQNGPMRHQDSFAESWQFNVEFSVDYYIMFDEIPVYYWDEEDYNRFCHHNMGINMELPSTFKLKPICVKRKFNDEDMPFSSNSLYINLSEKQMPRPVGVDILNYSMFNAPPPPPPPDEEYILKDPKKLIALRKKVKEFNIFQ